MKIGQAEILECLQKHDKPISRKQIAEEINSGPEAVSKLVKKLLKRGEIKCVEFDRVQAGKMLGLGRPFRRTRFYYV